MFETCFSPFEYWYAPAQGGTVVVVVGSTTAGVVVVVVSVDVSEVATGRFVGGTPPPAVEHPVSGTTPLVE
jgi:hypothetical protein